MKVAVIGAGEVGRHVVRVLAREGHYLTVVDMDAEAVRRIDETEDVQLVQGHGASLTVLRRAQVAQADLVIAVTDSDETNMLAALSAKQLGAHKSVARVRNATYYDETAGLSKGVLGIDMLVNPHQLTAFEIQQLIRSTGTISVQNFADNRVEMVQMLVTHETRHLDRPLAKLKLPRNALVAAILRGKEIVIPRGDDYVSRGDDVFLLGDIAMIPKLKAMFGVDPNLLVRRVIIAGGGDIAQAVARKLEEDGIECELIERDLQRCTELSQELHDVVVLHGDATDTNLLKQERVDRCDLFLALTHEDETNIMASLLAKQRGAPRAVALMRRGDYAHLCPEIGIDVAVSPRHIAANTILEFVRSEQIRAVQQLEDGRAEILEFLAPDNCPIVGRALMSLNFPEGAIIGVIVRDGKVFVPGGHDEVQGGDSVIVFALPQVRKRVERLFQPRSW